MDFKRICLAAGVVLGLLWAGPAMAACDISQLACAADGKKCNIKFINNTGKASGSGGGTGENQISYATTLKLRAEKADETRAGSNSFELLAGQNHTMNMDKKTGFDTIKIWSTIATNATTGAFRIPCGDIRKILANDKNCKIFVSKSKNVFDSTQILYWLNYNCDVAVGYSDKPFAKIN